MSTKALQQRWNSAEGLVLAEEALRFLLGVGRDLPEGIGTHEGRRDLRGLVLPDPKSAGSVVAGGVRAEAISGICELRGARWQALDLSQSRLSSLRFFGSVVADCRFDGAICRDWRLWDSEVRDSSFASGDLRDAALGTWHDGRTNTWRNVDFDGADLRGVLALGCLIAQCSFVEARLKGVEFQQATIRHCQFTGALQDVLFDGREIAGRPQPGVFVDVDFSKAKFEDVEFRGCRFDDVKLPAGIYAIPRFPRVARRVLELLEHDESVEARMLRAELNLTLKLPGGDASVGVFNRADYIASGGERLADLAESLLIEAAGETSR
ncbi:MAG: pentapeptide repeat-containing protein [Aeromicrobium sp.]|nr:pentapeptide repeat-containing protein [Aeromicrobium sp.]